MKRIITFLALLVCGFSYMMPQNPRFLFDDFEKAIITFTDGTQSKDLMNYDFMTDRFIFVEQETDNILMVSNPQTIRSIRIANRVFIIEGEAGVEIMPTTPVVYVQYKAKVRQEANIGAYGTRSETAGISSFGNTYNSYGERINLSASKELITANHYNVYWVEKKGGKKKFTNFKQFLKIYSNHKDTLEKYIKENKIEFNNAKQVAELCVYADSL